MTLIEAIKSGKRFKRECFQEFLSMKHEKISFENGIDLTFVTLREKDYLADDWILEEKEITITESQLEDVIKQSLIKHGSSSSNFIEHIKKELGF
jgi:hypothetical protein